MNKPTPAYVYLLRTADDKYYKYGRTIDMKKRLQNLQTGAQIKWEVAHLFKCAGFGYAIQLEKHIKDKLSGRCTARKGETFQSATSELNWLVFEISTKTKELYPEWGIEKCQIFI